MDQVSSIGKICINQYMHETTYHHIGKNSSSMHLWIIIHVSIQQSSSTYVPRTILQYMIFMHMVIITCERLIIKRIQAMYFFLSLRRSPCKHHKSDLSINYVTPIIIWTTHNHITAISIITKDHNANNALRICAPPEPVPSVRSDHAYQ